jgi:ATP-binding protein involved in chromosome partitioning
MSITKEQVVKQLRRIPAPSGRGDLVSAGLVANVAACEDFVRVTLALPTAGAATQEQMRVDIDAAIREVWPDARQINVEFTDAAPAQAPPTAPKPPQETARESNPLPGVRHVIAIGAGKGGVGKSTIAVNLAVGLARDGRRVGLLDGDIYGPSTPTLLGLDDHQATGTAEMLQPFAVHGITTMTIGKLVDPEKALIWRGPMAHGAFRQLALQTDWGELDYLIVDLPPGTGDVPLTLAQMLPLTGAVIVCTPQKVAQDDAVRAVRMFEQLDIRVLGVVENMSYFVGDDGKEYDIFGRGGALMMAKKLDLMMLGTIPINTAIRANGDAGDPRKNFEGDDALAEELTAMCRRLHEQVARHGAARPTLNVK